MSNQDHFTWRYLNASQCLFEKYAAFHCNLATPIDLGAIHRWEVGLVNIPILPRRRNNLRPRQAFIYCDMISPQYLGTSLVKCLRTSFYSTSSGHCIYDPIFYVPVETRSFDSISFQIMNLLGQRVPYPPSKIT